MALNATPKSPTANSYQTVEEISEVLAGRLYTDDWTSTTNGKKEAVAIWGTRLMERGLVFEGSVSSNSQALAFPRAGLVDQEHRAVNVDTIPMRVREAHAELCLLLLRRDRTEEPEILGQGLKSLTVGPISLSVDAEQEIPLIPQTVLMLLGDWATLRDGSPGVQANTVKLMRA